MYLQERLKRLPSVSLYVGVLLAMVSILSLSFLAFHLIADHVQKIEIEPTFDKFDELQLESARIALQNRGQAGLRDYLDNLNRIFGGKHYLLDANGIDLVTGTNRTWMLPASPATSSRVRAHGRWTLAHRTPDDARPACPLPRRETSSWASFASPLARRAARTWPSP